MFAWLSAGGRTKALSGIKDTQWVQEAISSTERALCLVVVVVVGGVENRSLDGGMTGR